MAFFQDSTLSFQPLSEEALVSQANGKFVVALDFDGVISAPYRLKADYINELGYTIAPEESEKADCLRLGVSKEDYDKGSMRAYMESPEILPLEPHFKENFSKIRGLSQIFIVVVTSRYNHMISHLEQFLKYHNIRVNAVIHTESASKSGPLEMIGARVFVDDSWSKLVDAKNSCSQKFERHFIFYRNIYNVNKKITDENVSDIRGWPNLARAITSLHRKIIKE